MSVEARAALARCCRQFSNSLILFTISGAGFALDLLNVLGDSRFAVVYWMDDLGNDACQWTGIRHGAEYNTKIRGAERVEEPQAQRAGKKSSLELALHPWMDSGLMRVGVRLSALLLI